MRTASVAASCVLLCGCGLLANGTTRWVPVRSHPSGAEVWVDGVYAGVTPLRVEADPAETHQVEVRAEGLRPRLYQLEPHVEAVFIALDIIFTAGVGAIVDALTDGWDVPSPETIHARLERLGAGEATPHPTPAPAAAPRLAPPTEEPPGAAHTPEGYGRHGP